jgi:hypothetical protein
MVRTSILFCRNVLLVLSAATHVGPPACAASIRTFVNRSYSYQVEYPVNWYFAGDAKRFYIHSFPSSHAVKGVVLPKGGAEISISVPAQTQPESGRHPRNLEDWIATSTAKQDVISRRTFEISAGRSVIEVTSRCCGRPPFIESHQWFVELDGALYRASLGFWQNDPSAESLIQTLKSVVLSLRNLAP